ncbi:MAG: hypothetical protein U9Q21_01865 [Candidatus Auribacterota bacterium]|nr:hypothetical protein [Candidatus Auribacterota bacterium]
MEFELIVLTIIIVGATVMYFFIKRRSAELSDEELVKLVVAVTKGSITNPVTYEKVQIEGKPEEKVSILISPETTVAVMTAAYAKIKSMNPKLHDNTVFRMLLKQRGYDNFQIDCCADAASSLLVSSRVCTFIANLTLFPSRFRPEPVPLMA